MEKIIEKESRAMLTKEQYEKVCSYFLSSKLPYKRINNYNYYIDTPDFKLISSHNMLRVRQINDDQFELTFKIKGNNGDIEITENLNKQDAIEIIHNNLLISGNIANELKKYNINITELKTICKLYTYRLSFQDGPSKIEIDYNEYNNIIDYNIEIESEISLQFSYDLLEKYSKLFGFEISKNYKVKSYRALTSIN